MSGVVDVVEPTGPDTMVILNVGGQMMTARLGSRDRPKLGDTMTLAVDTRRGQPLRCGDRRSHLTSSRICPVTPVG